MDRIGVVGLGRMGSAIAQRMAAQGHPVIGWTRSGRTLDGIPSAPDIASLIEASDAILTSLYDDAAVAEVLDLLTTCDLGGKQVIETSTVVPSIIQDRAEALIAKGATVVDAPISGGPELVLSGNCGVFLGGNDMAAKRAQKTLMTLTERQFHMGPLGAGLVMKTINNSMIQVYFNGLQDMMRLSKRAGLEMEQTLRILLSGPAAMPMLLDRLPRILGEDTSAGFTINAGRKDAEVFARVIKSYGIPTDLMEIGGAKIQAVVDAGLGDEDPARLISYAYETG